MAKKNENLFQKLTKLFKSGPVVKRKIRNLDTTVAVPDRTKSSGALLFQKSMAPTYATITANAYNLSERLMRYQDFAEMEYTAEIASAMDIYADETCAQDDKGRVLHVYSDNEKVREILEELFYNTLNVEFNLRSWARNLPVHKDTVIPLLNGTEITIENLSKRMKEDPAWVPWVYSVQDGTHRLVPGKVTWCGLTRRDSELVRVWLDDGSYVDCTPDHEWILRDGSRKKAEDLVTGDSMMPLYRDVSSKKKGHRLEGYERTYDPGTGKYEYTHRLVSESAVPSPENWHVVHHVNFDKRNNAPENLRKMTWKDHSLLHMKSSDTLKRPDVVEKRMLGIDRWLRSEEHRAVAKGQLKKLQAAGLMKTSWSEYNKSSLHTDHNAVRSKSMKAHWSDEGKKARWKASLTIKFDARCIDMLVDRLERLGKYVSPVVLGSLLKEDEEFMAHFRSINVATGRDLTKSLSSHAGIESLLMKVGVSSYIGLVKDRLPTIASTPWFKRAERKSLRMTGKAPGMRSRRSSRTKETSPEPAYMNHKVDRVERLSSTSDVYCMEVLGPTGEHDRHNFMVLTRFSDGTTNLNSGICSQNCKYGDMFLYNDVSPDHGVINAFPIPVNEIEREENYDPNDPMAVRYRWVTLGNRTLENWEVTHFRLLGNDMFLPYGSSIIEPARRIWRQLILIEDAMLVYRVVRAPERRVFYIDVANIPPENVPMYVEEQRKNLRSSQVIDRTTGRVDLRYNPLSVDEDYFIPVRGGESGTKIDTLAGGQNAAAVEDVAYIQKKLFAALKIPRAYLGYDEALSSKATLAQEDIRFSRTINVIQKTIISELNKLAIIHLYAHGFDSEDLQNFTLRLSNPSTVAQQQKLELWRAKFEIAGSAPEGQVSKEFIRKEIWGLNEEQCKQLDDQRLKEKLVDGAIENAKPDEGGGEAAGGGEEAAGGGEESGGDEGGGDDLFSGDDISQKEPGLDLITAGDDPGDDEDFPVKFSVSDIEVPVKAQRQLDRALYNRSRIKHNGASKTHMPDFLKMTTQSRQSDNDPYDSDWVSSYVRNPFGESVERRTEVYKTPISNDVISALRMMSLSKKFQNLPQQGQPDAPASQVLNESIEEADAKEFKEVYVIDEDDDRSDET
ncbi:MAG: hypothetical protein EBR82_00660 [Caulobacteraceae bacterium]|nr:hypothetical protein [Caulobacteraceae bacterium]